MMRFSRAIVSISHVASTRGPVRVGAAICRFPRRCLVSSAGGQSATPLLRHVVARRALPVAATRSMFIQTEPTPNPQSMKFFPNCELLAGEDMPSTMDFPNAMSALASPLARRIFLVDGVSGVFLGRDFLTVSVRDPDPEWSALKPQIFAAIMEHFASGEPVLGDDADRGSSDTMIDENDSEVVQQIKELLETRIRPMVQEDGGDIRFVEFDEDGIVRLSLQGACSTCPSSTATLKGGIENMLMHYISEVRGVEEVLPEDDPELGPVVQANNEALERLEKSLGRAD